MGKLNSRILVVASRTELRLELFAMLRRVVGEVSPFLFGVCVPLNHHMVYQIKTRGYRR
jgi:hypothetical protein